MSTALNLRSTTRPTLVAGTNRQMIVGALLLAATIAVGLWSMVVGDFPISVRQVVGVIGRNDDSQHEFIVMTLRLPRVITGIFVGAALGMSGAVFQSLVRNPLGSPDIIGFNSGAAAGAVFVILVIGGSALQIALGAIAGGVATSAAVFGLSIRSRTVAPGRLVLVGIGTGFALTAVIDYLLTRSNINDVQQAAVWLTGSLNGRDWGHVVTAGVALGLAMPLALLAERTLNVLALGDDAAAALGIKLTRSKLTLVMFAISLSSLAVAAAGPVVFVAFVAGPIARRLANSPNACVALSALVGAFMLVASDLLARRILAPTELPVGVTTAIIGGPYLLWLLTRSARSGAL